MVGAEERFADRGDAGAHLVAFEEARIGAIETDNKTGIKKFNVTISLAAGESA